MQLAPENSVSRIIGIRANSLTSMPSQSSQWSWNAGSIESINSVNQPSGLWTPRSKWAPTAPGRKYEQDDNDDKRNSQVTGICKVLVFTKKRSQTQQCIPAHLLVLLFMRPWSFGSVLQVRLSQIKSYQIHFSNAFQSFRVQKEFCSPFGSSGSSGTTCPLPGCWDRRSLPTSQTWSGLGCTILLVYRCHTSSCTIM